MKRKIILTTLVALATTFTLNARGGYFGGHHHGWGNGSGYRSIFVANLTQKQKDDLIFMYQEEKMARDVYIALGKKWGERVFLNIQRSEQNHMNAIERLLNKYSLSVLVDNSDIGHFANEELQALYNDLLAKGNLSLKDALEVGVAIEETDIADLEEKMANTPLDILKSISKPFKR
jgi:hypothetical protein